MLQDCQKVKVYQNFVQVTSTANGTLISWEIKFWFLQCNGYKADLPENLINFFFEQSFLQDFYDSPYLSDEYINIVFEKNLNLFSKLLLYNLFSSSTWIQICSLTDTTSKKCSSPLGHALGKVTCCLVYFGSLKESGSIIRETRLDRMWIRDVVLNYSLATLRQ